MTQIALMRSYNINSKNKKTILALGPESDGNFSIYKNEKIYFSGNFGDLLVDANFNKYKHELNEFLKKENIKPDVILTDLHPLYRTTLLGEELAKKYKAKHIQVQHHIVHIFSAVGEKIIKDNFKFQISNLKLSDIYGIALDGTGYGLDGKIWGGEVFKITNSKLQITNKLQIQNYKLQIERIGHLENQIMIGGDLAVKEPARMLIAILAKIRNPKSEIRNKSQILNLKSQKDFIFQYIKKFYTRNEFEVLYNQLQQNFNCVETSSTGRVLDAVSVLLGFAGNKRDYKHEAAGLLEKNSTKPYTDLRPKFQITNYKSQINSKSQIQNYKHYELLTTPLFEYLIKNLHKDKRRLAATAQQYIAEGLWEICQMLNVKCQMFLSGGLANNKIISSYLSAKGGSASGGESTPARNGSRSDAGGGVIAARQVPRGDAGLSFGQIVYYLSI